MPAMSKSVPIGELHVTVQRLLPAKIAGIDADHIRRVMQYLFRVLFEELFYCKLVKIRIVVSLEYYLGIIILFIKCFEIFLLYICILFL